MKHFAPLILVACHVALSSTPAVSSIEERPAAHISPPSSLTNSPAAIPLSVLYPAESAPVIRAERPAWEVLGSFERTLAADEFWRAGEGLSADILHWSRVRWGIGISASVTDWEAAGGELDLPFALHHQFDVEGSAQTLQLGLLGAYRYPLGGNVEMLARAGVSYLATDSSIRVSTSYVDYFGNEVSYSSFTDNVTPWMGRAGLALRCHARGTSATLFAQAGIDYQVTLAGDDQGWLRETIASDFEALWARVGLGVSF